MKLKKTDRVCENNEMPKVSIITVCYNSARTIKDTINSVVNQSYSNIEYIIIDGGSNDGTMDIIKKYEKNIAKWVSEPDEGIYDAMNKGIRISTGEIIGIINSDDWYADDAIVTVVNVFLNNPEIDVVHGNIIICDVQGNKEYMILGCDNIEDDIFKRMTIFHPTMFVKKEVYDREGLYDKKYQIAADYDFVWKILHKYNIVHIDKVLAYMRLGGISNTSFLRQAIEYFNIRNKHNVNLIINILITIRAILGPYIRKFFEKRYLVSLIQWYRKKRYKGMIEYMIK